MQPFRQRLFNPSCGERVYVRSGRRHGAQINRKRSLYAKRISLAVVGWLQVLEMRVGGDGEWCTCAVRIFVNGPVFGARVDAESAHILT